MLTPAMQQLVPVIVRATQFPDNFRELEKDKQDDFRKWFRFEVSDVLLTVAAIIGVEETLSAIAALLQATLTSFSSAVAYVWRASLLSTYWGSSSHRPHDPQPAVFVVCFALA